MQHETANVVLPAEPELLREHLRARQAEGVRMNVNFLGEALLGEEEAQRRLRGLSRRAAIAGDRVLSVKISTLYSQISAARPRRTPWRSSATGWSRSIARRRIASTMRPDGVRAKFVYLDMEEYRDMRLTAEAFMRTLERPGLEQVRAGIALQAYLPDSRARAARDQRLGAPARGRAAARRSPCAS